MAEWRPEGWENPFIVKKQGKEWKNPEFLVRQGSLVSAFEAGADAMLESLKKKGAWMTPEQMTLLAPDRQYPYGYLVFIPETTAGDELNDKRQVV